MSGAVGLSGLHVVALGCEFSSNDEETSSWSVRVIKMKKVLHDQKVVVTGRLEVEGKSAKAFAVVGGIARWDEQDLPGLTADSEDLPSVLGKSDLMHALYDTAAMVVRQALATLGSDLRVARTTPESRVEMAPSLREARAAR